MFYQRWKALDKGRWHSIGDVICQIIVIRETIVIIIVLSYDLYTTCTLRSNLVKSDFKHNIFKWNVV